MNKYFKLEKNDTNIRTEVTAGFTTFLTMVYIIFVNPGILQAAGVPFDQVFMATIISAGLGTLIMALFANYPIALAPGMGLNAYFATIVGAQGLSYQSVFGTVFLAGILFILLSLTKVRETLIEAIPTSLKFGITAGIGLFIAFLGLRMSGIVVANPENLVSLGDLIQPITLLSIVGLLVTLILIALEVKGALFLGMIFTGITGFFTGHLEFQNGFFSLPPTPVFFDLDIASVFSQGLYAIVFVFLLITLFDTTGTLIGVSEQAGLMQDGKLPNAKSAFMADAVATTVGSTFGTSPSTAYVESASGVGAGGRTGLTSLVVALLFFAAMFFSPVVEAVANLSAITAPVLIIVGFYMMQGLAQIEWKNFIEAFPTFAIILTMPLTSSIATGIAVGFITYPLLKLIKGQGKEVHWILYVFAVLFIIQLTFFPMH